MKKAVSILTVILCVFAMQNIAYANDKGNSEVFEHNVQINQLPEDSLGKVIVSFANERIGDPYSIEKTGQESYLDCSGLTKWAYAQADIDIPYTAAEQARYAVENNKIVAKEDAMPGDLIFWSYPSKDRVKDRFMQIGHVAVYAGDGMMIESAPSANGVVFREVSVQGEPILYARLYV